MQSINFHDVCLLKTETERGMRAQRSPEFAVTRRWFSCCLCFSDIVLYYIFQLKCSWNTSQTLVLPSRASIVPRPSSNNLRLPSLII